MDAAHEEAAARYLRAQLELVEILAKRLGPDTSDLQLLHAVATSNPSREYNLQTLERDISIVNAWRDRVGPPSAASTE